MRSLWMTSVWITCLDQANLRLQQKTRPRGPRGLSPVTTGLRREMCCIQDPATTSTPPSRRLAPSSLLARSHSSILSSAGLSQDQVYMIPRSPRLNSGTACARSLLMATIKALQAQVNMKTHASFTTSLFQGQRWERTIAFRDTSYTRAVIRSRTREGTRCRTSPETLTEWESRISVSEEMSVSGVLEKCLAPQENPDQTRPQGPELTSTRRW